MAVRHSAPGAWPCQNPGSSGSYSSSSPAGKGLSGSGWAASGSAPLTAGKFRKFSEISRCWSCIFQMHEFTILSAARDHHSNLEMQMQRMIHQNGMSSESEETTALLMRPACQSYHVLQCYAGGRFGWHSIIALYRARKSHGTTRCEKRRRQRPTCRPKAGRCTCGSAASASRSALALLPSDSWATSLAAAAAAASSSPPVSDGAPLPCCCCSWPSLAPSCCLQTIRLWISD